MKPSCYLTAWWGGGTLTDKRVKRDNDLNFNCDLNFSHHFLCRFESSDHSRLPAEFNLGIKEIFMAPKLGRMKNIRLLSLIKEKKEKLFTIL